MDLQTYLLINLLDSAYLLVYYKHKQIWSVNCTFLQVGKLRCNSNLLRNIQTSKEVYKKEIELKTINFAQSISVCQWKLLF